MWSHYLQTVKHILRDVGRGETQKRRRRLVPTSTGSAITKGRLDLQQKLVAKRVMGQLYITFRMERKIGTSLRLMLSRQSYFSFFFIFVI